MNVFELRNRLVQDYAGYIGSFIQIGNARIRDLVEQSLADGLLWPEPLIQLNPTFEPGEWIDDLVRQGVLHAQCREVFRKNKEHGGQPLRLHRHQADAVRTARSGENYVLTTGTGSGKSLSYIIPIVDHVLRNGSGKGIQAIVVYPMNALANSQFGELEKFLCHGFPDGRGPVRFQKYTGEVNQDARAKIVADPPDILLTNYMMLELILTRPTDVGVINAAKGLRFLVMDELHTYRGRQGADVAMLVRRVRETLDADKLQHIGTSATLAGPGTFEAQRTEVAAVASRIFGSTVKPVNVIGETLRRATEHRDLQAPDFISSLTQRLGIVQSTPQTFNDFCRDPLAIWIESVFGLTKEPDTGRLIRAHPRSIVGPTGAAMELSKLTGVTEKACALAIQRALLAGYSTVHPETGFPVFAFRVHQFISRGDTVYASMGCEANRHLSVQGQKYVPGQRDKLLFPLAFCRECGQEYYVVRRTRQDNQTWGYESRDLSERSSTKDSQAGFVYINGTNPWPTDDASINERLPDDWVEEFKGAPRTRSNYRSQRPDRILIDEDGSTVEAHFIGAPFRFCLNCGVVYSGHQQSDYAKLAAVGAGGRSTATTILALATIRYLKRELQLSAAARKLLSFTDNRQDASLQAGHFNDFVQVSLLRSALYQAMLRAVADGIRHEELTTKIFEALKLDKALYASNPEARFKAEEDARRALREVIGYWIFIDLERGWRFATPNLEHCGLLNIEYQSLDELCRAEDVWSNAHAALRTASPETRQKVAQVLLDYMRRKLAIKVTYLDPNYHDQMKQMSYLHLREPWSFDEDEQLQVATILFPQSVPARPQERGLWLSPRGGFGKYIGRSRTFSNYTDKLSLVEKQEICEDLLEALRAAGLVEIVQEGKGDDPHGYQLVASGLIWKAGPGTHAAHDPIRVPRAPESGRKPNAFFVAAYKSELRDLHGLVAHEHTAQVPTLERVKRESEFREAKLPVLFCSPTMELGVDIAELNVVNMRNVPPTPANYAQRSGRAGRSGQPALVFTYCTTGSSHDQYFFKRPERMVSGKVSPPNIDLTNEDLIRAHIHAIWLATTGQSLGNTLVDILDTTGLPPKLTLHERVKDSMSLPGHRPKARLRAERVLNNILPDLNGSDWYHEKWLEDVLGQTIKNFDTACERWRQLYRAALAQVRLQTDVICDASRSSDDKRQAERLRREAEAQLRLLSESENSFQSDFYSYRYFASEGFLPGYNFPRLPLSAFIPARRGNAVDEFLSRPRFLAISEFGPSSLVYHEGSRYIINKVILPVSETGVALARAKVCDACGNLHPVDASGRPDKCERCGVLLAQPLYDLFRLENVSTKRRDRINSDEEERQRMGYELRTAIRFSEHGGRPAYRLAKVVHEDEVTAELMYGHAATLWRINLGWTRREKKEDMGFSLDMERGYWLSKSALEEDNADDPRSPFAKKVIPYVEDRRNSLLIQPKESFSEIQMASLQAALKAAIQAVFQLEDDEIATEPLPSAKNRRAILLFESAEGGAGVLRRLVDEPKWLEEVAREALAICHFDRLTGEDLRRGTGMTEDCEAACYNCLMNYSNQPDHALLDRAAIKDFLLSLATSKVVSGPTQLSRGDHLQQLRRAVGSKLEEAWLDFIEQQGLRLPSTAQQLIEACKTKPDFTYSTLDCTVTIYVDGPPHDYPERQQRDLQQMTALIDAGYLAIRFGHRDDWLKIVAQYPNVFGVPQPAAPVNDPVSAPAPSFDPDLFDPKWLPLLQRLLQEAGITLEAGEDILQDGRVIGASIAEVQRGASTLRLIDGDSSDAASIVSASELAMKPAMTINVSGVGTAASLDLLCTAILQRLAN